MLECSRRLAREDRQLPIGPKPPVSVDCRDDGRSAIARTHGLHPVVGTVSADTQAHGSLSFGWSCLPLVCALPSVVAPLQQPVASCDQPTWPRGPGAPLGVPWGHVRWCGPLRPPGGRSRPPNGPLPVKCPAGVCSGSCKQAHLLSTVIRKSQPNSVVPGLITLQVQRRQARTENQERNGGAIIFFGR